MSRDLKFWLKSGVLIVFFVIILGYSYYKTKDLFRGVRLEVEGIENGEIISSPDVILTGYAKNAVYVSINDREIFISQEGAFNETLILSSGYNIITITSRDKFGKEKEKIFEVTLKE